MSILTGDRFAEFFEALHNKPPFPWQIRLAEQIIGADRTEQAWPERIALPTASGKTACIDIAVFALACQASKGVVGQAVGAPRRIFFVVDRRVIVNQAFVHAKTKIADRLDAPDCEILRLVAESLRNLARGPYGEDASPLECFQLRGGIYRDDAWARSPTQPMVLCGTVDQIGSRLLFRGYGVSDKTRPLHAGLIANDSLIILDEAHCSGPFEQTIQAVRRYRGADWATSPLETPFSATIMSATPRGQGAEPFTLRSADYENETLGPRLRTPKPVRLIEVKAKTATAAFAQSLAHEALALAERGARRIAILVNRVDSAKIAFHRLNVVDDRKALFLGRMRPLDSQRMMRSWEPRLRADDDRLDVDDPIFVVATQCLEVGANFDFDGMVCECASLDALQQRFGRLARLGSGRSDAVIAISADDAKGKQPDPIYGASLASTWEWLNAHAKRLEAESAPMIDMGVEAVREALASTPLEAKEKLFPPSANAPVMLPAHVDCWVQTSPRPEPDPDVSLFLHGPNTGAPEVQVCWRADLEFDAADLMQPNERQKQQWLDALSLCPPASGECMPVPLHQLRRWMRGESIDSKILSDIEGADVFEETSGSGETQAAVVRWYGPSDDETAVVDNPSEVQPGETIVIPAKLKGWEQFGHIPGLSRGDVATDLGDEANFVARERPILRIYRDVVASWTAEAPRSAADKIAKSAARLVELSRAKELIESNEELDETPWLNEFRQELARLSRIEELPAWLRACASLADDPSLSEMLRFHPCGWLEFDEAFGRSPYPENASGRSGGASDAYTDRSRRISFDPATPGGLVLIGARPREARKTIDRFTHEDDSSLTTTRVPLKEHLEGVAQFAQHYAAGCGLPDDFQQLMEVVGLLHDIGKLDERFQAWLYGGNRPLAFAAAEPLAKSSRLEDYRARDVARRKSKYPKGGRHELLSLQMVAAEGNEVLSDSRDPELVLHLVASHHGNCRPFAPYVRDEHPPGVRWEFDCVSHSLSETQRKGWQPHALESGVGDRFWRLVRRYGWWGLAWLEAIFVLADRGRSNYEVNETASSRLVPAAFHEANE